MEFMAAVLFLGEKQLCLNTTLKVVSRSTMNRGNKRKRPLQFKELDLNTHKETDEIGDVVQVPKQMKIFILFYIHWNISYSTDNLIEKKNSLNGNNHQGLINWARNIKRRRWRAVDKGYLCEKGISGISCFLTFTSELWRTVWRMCILICTFSILFSIPFLKSWQGECV